MPVVVDVLLLVAAAQPNKPLRCSCTQPCGLGSVFMASRSRHATSGTQPGLAQVSRQQLVRLLLVGIEDRVVAAGVRQQRHDTPQRLETTSASVRRMQWRVALSGERVRERE